MSRHLGPNAGRQIQRKLTVSITRIVMTQKAAALLTLSAMLLVETVSADNGSCPEARPYPRGTSACDSCPWEETLADYEAGELSTIRESDVFEHSIRVSVVCDVDRPVNIDDVYEKISETEQMFYEFLEPVIHIEDGNEVMLEVITGICDYGGGIDDCVMYTVCREGGIGSGCDVSSGQAFANSGGVATHTTFVPFLPEGTFWWIEGNRYGNLQHEFTHLLDYTYLRVDAQRGTDLDWWVEGLPQFIQWKILNDRLSWDRGNDNARLLEIFTHRWNTNDYYDGMRVFAFLHSNTPYWLQILASDVRDGIYRSAESHLAWYTLLGYISSRHEDSYRQFVEFQTESLSRPARTRDDIVGVIEGIGQPVYVHPGE